jgi:hypothetical protein
MSDIASTTVPVSGSGFMIGDVLGRTFSILGRNFVPFFLLTAVATIPYLGFYLAMPTFTPGRVTMPNFSGLGLPLAIGFVLKMFTQAVILNAAFQDMRGRKVSVGESFAVGLSRFFPIIGVILLVGLGMAVGLILLVVPGIILMLMWYLALPACVVEKLGPIGSLSRSAELTKGHRWKILGLILIVAIAGGIINGVFSAISANFGHVPHAIVQYIMQALIGVFGAILVIVLYRDLRVAKEGIGTEQIAAVFD